MTYGIAEDLEASSVRGGAASLAVTMQNVCLRSQTPTGVSA